MASVVSPVLHSKPLDHPKPLYSLRLKNTLTYEHILSVTFE